MRITFEAQSITSTNVDGIVFPWHKTLVPWFLTPTTEEMAKEVKDSAGSSIFLELPPALTPRKAHITSAGALAHKYKGIIHISPSSLLGTTVRQIEKTVKKALELADSLGWKSLAFPLFGQGLGGFEKDALIQIMLKVLRNSTQELEKVVLCVFGTSPIKSSFEMKSAALCC